MRGLGTIINALAIVIGGVLGILFKRFLKERYLYLKKLSRT